MVDFSKNTSPMDPMGFEIGIKRILLEMFGWWPVEASWIQRRWRLESGPVTIQKMHLWKLTWMFPKIVVSQNWWFIMENPTKIDDLGVPLIFGNTHMEPKKR